MDTYVIHEKYNNKMYICISQLQIHIFITQFHKQISTKIVYYLPKHKINVPLMCSLLSADTESERLHAKPTPASRLLLCTAWHQRQAPSITPFDVHCLARNHKSLPINRAITLPQPQMKYTGEDKQLKWGGKQWEMVAADGEKNRMLTIGRKCLKSAKPLDKEQSRAEPHWARLAQETLKPLYITHLFSLI